MTLTRERSTKCLGVYMCRSAICCVSTGHPAVKIQADKFAHLLQARPCLEPRIGAAHSWDSARRWHWTHHTGVSKPFVLEHRDGHGLIWLSVTQARSAGQQWSKSRAASCEEKNAGPKTFELFGNCAPSEGPLRKPSLTTHARSHQTKNARNSGRNCSRPPLCNGQRDVYRDLN